MVADDDAYAGDEEPPAAVRSDVAIDVFVKIRSTTGGGGGGGDPAAATDADADEAVGVDGDDAVPTNSADDPP